MTIYYVDGAVGDDANAGTSEGAGNAWATISHAATQVVPDDVVYVKASVSYAENVVFTVNAASSGTTKIFWIGYLETPGDHGQVTVTGSGSGAIFSTTYTANFGNHWMNFKLDNGPSNGFLGVNVDGCSFTNCSFSNNSGGGCQVQNSCTFVNCEASGNGGGGIQSISGRFYGCKMQNNTLDGIRSSSILIYKCAVTKNGSSSAGSSYQAGGGNAGSILASVFHGAGSTGRTNGIDGTITDTTIMDNIIMGCDDGIDVNTYSDHAYPIVNNHFHDNTVDLQRGVYSLTPLDNNKDVSGDPLFTDPDNDDYSIGSGSPAIDSGIVPGNY